MGVHAGSGYYSTNWGGDFRCQLMQSGSCVNPGGGNEITDVSGGWIVNSLASTSSATESASTWVGIGGWGSSDLVQDGIFAEIAPDGSTYYGAWWEMLPASATFVSLSPDATISPGNQFYASVEYQGENAGGYQLWQFTLEDLSTSSSWSGTEVCGSSCYGSSFSTADWIQESPEIGSTIVQIPAFSSFPFIDPQYYSGVTGWFWNSNVNWAWQQNTAYTPAVTVVPSGLYADPDMFYIDYLADTQRQTTSCCGISQSSAEPGQLITGSDSLSSPDSFGSNQAQNLGLEVALIAPNGSMVDKDAADGSIGFSMGSGQNSYGTSFAVKQGIAYGSYYVLLMLWYVPAGRSIGGAGSLLLQEAGGVAYGPSLDVYGPTVSQPVADPVSGMVDAGQSATLSTTATGGSGGYSYSWAGLPSVCTQSSSPSIVCQGLSQGRYSTSVTVTDSAGAEFTSASLTFVVNVDPSISGIAADRSSVDAGQSVSFTAGVAGGTGSYIFVWTGLPASSCASTDTSTAACSALAAQDLTVGVTATDSAGMEASGHPLSYTVLSDPSLGALRPSPATVDVGQTVTFLTSASGGSGGYSYSWTGLPTGCNSINASSVSCVPTASGSFAPAVQATDSNGVTATTATTYLVSPLPTVQAPAAAAPSITEGDSVTFTATAGQGSGGLTYVWHDLPTGCASADNPMIACTPNATGTWNVSVTVTDSNGGAATSGTFPFTVVSPPAPSVLGLPAVEAYAIIGAIIAAALVAVTAVLLLRRRKKADERPSSAVWSEL